jgi:protein TonB
MLVHGLLIFTLVDRLSFESAATVSAVPVTMNMFASVDHAAIAAGPVAEAMQEDEPVLTPPVKPEETIPIPAKQKPETAVLEKKSLQQRKITKLKPETKAAIPRPDRQARLTSTMPTQNGTEKVPTPDTTQTKTSDASRINQLRLQYRQALLELIEANKFYPKRARRKHQQGTATITFTIHRDGSISSLQLQESSGFAALDKAALVVIQNIGHYDPLPVELDLSRWKFVIPISYKLL